MYFEKFPQDLYSLDDLESVQVITNILRRVTLSDELKSNSSIYDVYDIKEGDTPEKLADKFYNNSNYHWVILHINDILDPRFDWPLSSLELEQFVKSKYGIAYIQSTHHWEDANKNWVNSSYPNSTAISNYTYEDRLNEEKRSILILKPKYIFVFEQEFDRLIKL